MASRDEQNLQKRYDIPQIVVALVVFSVAVWLGERRLGGASRQTEADVPVLVAAIDIAAGALITEDALAVRPYPARAVTAAMARPEDRLALVDLPAALDIGEDTPILRSFVEGIPVDDRLSAKLDPGERAITIAVDPVTGLAGHVRPNDQVDVVATFQLPGLDAASATRTRTLLRGVTILAVGAQTGSDAPSSATRSRGRSGTASTVTLRVSSGDAELLTFASNAAELRLVLRRQDDEIEVVHTDEGVGLDAFFEVPDPAAKKSSSKRTTSRVTYDR